MDKLKTSAMEWFKSNEKKLQVALYYTVLFVIFFYPISWTYAYKFYAEQRTFWRWHLWLGVVFVLAALLAKCRTSCHLKQGHLKQE
jgi:pheromone shutdown protein TraB